MIGPSFTLHSICLNRSSFVWKCCVFPRNSFNLKGYCFSENLFRSLSNERFKIFSGFQIKICQSLKRKAILKIYFFKKAFLEEPMLFLLTLAWNLWEWSFSYVKGKINSHFVERSSRLFSVYSITLLVQKNLCS